MLLFTFRLLSVLPLSALQVIGRIGGRLVYLLSAQYRARLQANAKQAGYTEPAFARLAAGEAGAMVMELARVWFKTSDCLSRVVSGQQEHVLTEAIAEGRGILFLTPHLGSFEMAARYGAQHQPVTVMFRPPRKAILEPTLQAARNASGVRTVPASRHGVRAFLKALKQQETVGMLPDQVPSEGEGVWAPFFGREAWTVTLPGKLASATNAIVMVVACERLPKGKGWRMHYMRAPEPLPETAKAQAMLFNHMMQTLISRFPEQYLWGYDRYKRPANVAPPPETAVD